MYISVHITRRQIESIPVNEILIILIFLFSQKFISMNSDEAFQICDLIL